MSGSALCPWAFTREPRKHAKKLGALLNCPNSDMSELVDCLQSMNASKIAFTHSQFFVRPIFNLNLTKLKITA